VIQIAKSICIDRKPVAMTCDYNGISNNYFYDFIRNEVYPAYIDEFTEEDIKVIESQMKNNKDHIYLFGKNENNKTYIRHSFTISDVLATAKCDYDGL
jgi:hypothetical protein